MTSAALDSTSGQSKKDATHVIARNKKGTTRRPEVTKKEREATPPALCEWLVSLAHSCKKVQP